MGAGNSVVAFVQGKHPPTRDQSHPMSRAHTRPPKYRLTRHDTVSGTHTLGARFEVADVNGAPGVVVAIDDAVAAVLALGIYHGLIDVIHAVDNPAKLGHLQDPAGSG